ncbi:hypothetical protein IGS68_18675 [Skermanella sp. TT6]|uniref:Uncharacterized protein n=1 Tax=Skermanella cutis TaxID=2775420 RepID=A0ABX7B188_9PROT|nr:hypothetical protein [Skermanella sp. TT6]QQP88075.1 hypothetical protein IGS68_18675 [Skermanella sp. TT6]
MSVPASNRRVTYTLATLRRGVWQTSGTIDSLDSALARARETLGTGKVERVRVEQCFTDPGAKRAVMTTVFEEAGAAPPRFEVNAWMLLGISVLLGIAAFLITGFLLQGPGS